MLRICNQLVLVIFSGSSQLMSAEEKLKSAPEAVVQGPRSQTETSPLTYLFGMVSLGVYLKGGGTSVESVNLFNHFEADPR